MPPAPAILGCGVLYAGSRAILGPSWADAFFAFFLVGFLAYDYIHLAVHKSRPRTRVGRFLRRGQRWLADRSCSRVAQDGQRFFSARRQGCAAGSGEGCLSDVPKKPIAAGAAVGVPQRAQRTAQR